LDLLSTVVRLSTLALAAVAISANFTVGAGLGLFATPAALDLFGWRGAFTAWGALGLAIAPWLAVYFALSYRLPLDLSAMLGAVGLLAGMLFRPLGGMLLSRKVFTHSALMRTGTALACVGMALLALPLHVPLVTGWGLTLFACGTTLPYAAVFDEAGHIGAESGLGPGTAQGVISVLSAPASAFGPPLIGALLGQQRNFALPFGALVPIAMVSLIAALVAGPLVTRSRNVAGLLRLRERDGDAYLAEILASHSHVTRHASTLPAIVTLGAHAQGRGTAIIRRLQHAGSLPLLLPPSPSPTEGEAGDLLADGAFFRETFDRCIWPLFCQLLLGQTRRRDRAFVRQPYQLQVACGQETTGTFTVIAPAAARQPRKQEAATKTVPIQRVKPHRL
jgi:hypothetical protein